LFFAFGGPRDRALRTSPLSMSVKRKKRASLARENDRGRFARPCFLRLAVPQWAKKASSRAREPKKPVENHREKARVRAVCPDQERPSRCV